MPMPPSPPLAPGAVTVEQLSAEVAAYRAARVARLTAADGWLSIIGKFWLSEGSVRLGANAECELRLPAASAPSILGSVTLRDGVVRFDADPAASVFADGRLVGALTLRSDVDGAPTTLVSGTLTVQLLRRGDDLALRVRDSNHALRRQFRGIPAYPVDPLWRIVASLRRFEQERSILYEDSDGRPEPYACPGVVVFEKGGVVCELWPVFDAGRQRLFVLFSDRTNADETYGAGRFLYASLAEGPDARVILDFNKAFNPPCAFTAFAACPLPPQHNRLTLRVEAGEKRPFVDDDQGRA